MALSRTNLLGQVHPTPTGNHGTTDFTTNSFTPPSNSLLVVGVSVIENSGSTTDPLSSITVSGGGWTYTGGPGVTVSPTSFPTATKIFTAPVGTGASMTLTIGTGGRSIGEYSVTVVAYTGYNTGAPTGATATGTQGSGFTGPPTPFSITLSAAPASASEVFAVAGMDKTVAGASPGTTGTWTEVDDVENTDWGGLESQARTGSTSTTVDWADLRSGGGALFNVAAVAIEIVAAAASSVTPGPLVITATRVGPLASPTVLRSTLADPPVLTTNGPLVVSRPARIAPAPLPTLSRSSLADVVIPSAATPGPIVVTQPARQAPSAPIVARATLADPAVLTTPAPIVVSPPTRSPVAAQALFVRSSLIDLATPGPLVVTSRAAPARIAPILLSRSSLADAIVPAGAATPQPIVVTSAVRPPWAYRPIVLAGSSSQVCDCITHRSTGATTARPSVGTTARPATGVTARPCNC